MEEFFREANEQDFAGLTPKEAEKLRVSVQDFEKVEDDLVSHQNVK